MIPTRQTTPQRCCRGAISICLGIAGAIACLSPARAAVTEDNFLARTTDDIVAVCAVEPSDPLYQAAVNFCHGFALGTYHTLREIMAAEPKIRLFCVAEPPPSRNEAIAAFVTWARAHPDRGAAPPTESFAAYLADRYPCPPLPAGRHAHVKKP